MIIFRYWNNRKAKIISITVNYGNNTDFYLHEDKSKFIISYGTSVESYEISTNIKYNLSNFFYDIEKHIGETTKPLYIDYFKDDTSSNNSIIFRIVDKPLR